MIINNSSKLSNNFYCEKCDYYANRKGDYNKHLQTLKHNDNNDNTDDNKKSSYACKCGKSYLYKSGLSRHKKKCKFQQKEASKDSTIVTKPVEPPNLNTMFMTLMDTNKELQQIICKQNDKLNKQNEKLIELASRPQVINNIEKQKNTFNLQNYLNVDCKDAMNLSDFLNTIQLNFDDLLYLGNNGFAKSFENTFIKQLKNMEETKRPVHCTDKKRKVVYIKETNKWEKDNEHEQLKGAIQTMNKKQITTFSKHKNNNPTWIDKDDSNIDTQNKIIQTICEYNDTTKSQIDNKIIKNISDKVGL